MMSSLRKGASNWLIKLFLMLLAVSFVIWGVADVFRGYGSRAIATVAGREIQPEQFEQAFETDLQRMQQQYGQAISRDMARRIGLESQTLSRLIGDAVLDAHARDLKLGITDQAVLDTVKQDPSFHGADGSFSKDIFANVLRSNGLTEAGFFATQRQSQVRGQVAVSTQVEKSVPATAVSALYRYRNETRTVSFMPIPADKAAAVAEPDEAKLKTHHETFKAQYSAPEYRKLALLTLNPDSFKKPAEITEDDVKATYESRKAGLGSPEKRTVQLLSFKDLAAAEKGFAQLRAGKDFLALGRELGLKDADINLGSQTKAAMIDQVIAETAFGLKKLEVSKPFQGTFSIVVVRSTEIVAAIEKTYDQVKGELRETLARDKALQEAQAVQDKIETARSRGASLKELAEKHALKLQEIAAVDSNGLDPEGKPVADLAGGPRVLPRAFQTEVGVEAEGVDLQDGLVAWFEVQAITPPVLRPFEAVKDQVAKDWRAIEQRKAVQELAQKLADRLTKGDSLEALAKELGQKIVVTKPFKRDDKLDELSPSSVARAFTLAKGASAQVEAGKGPEPAKPGDVPKSGRLLIRLDAVTVPGEPSAAETDKLATEIARQLADDFASQYMAALQARYGVRVNQDAFNRATGRASQ